MIIAGTGHRPHKMGNDYLLRNSKTLAIIDRTSNKLKELGATGVISGMAQGFDQMLVLAAEKAGIPVVAAIPCHYQYSKWPYESQLLYMKILAKCEVQTYITDGPYVDGCMVKRDYWMVDNSDGLLAYYNGTPGGTAKTIEYAHRVGKVVWNIYDE